jgi:hypothetical protein
MGTTKTITREGDYNSHGAGVRAWHIEGTPIISAE